MSIDFGQSTGINFSLSDDQKKVQLAARDFAENVLAPVVRDADREPDPLKAFQMTKPAYVEAYKRGIAFCMLPKEYGGGGLTNVELILAAEEICAVDPGFAYTVLMNGLALLPVWYWGTEEQKQRVLRAATSDTSGEYLAGYAASEPPGPPGGAANFDAPMPHPVGIGVTARRDGDHYVLNGRKYWPCNVGGWDGEGANVNLVVVRTDPDSGGTEGLSALLVERGTPGVTYNIIETFGHRLTPNSEIVFQDARVPADNLVQGTLGNGDLLINRNFAWSGPVAGIAAVGVARAAYEAALTWAKTYTAGGPQPIIHYQNVGYILGDVAARIEACRLFCWRTAHYLDHHDYHAELIGAAARPVPSGHLIRPVEVDDVGSQEGRVRGVRWQQGEVALRRAGRSPGGRRGVSRERAPQAGGGLAAAARRGAGRACARDRAGGRHDLRVA